MIDFFTRPFFFRRLLSGIFLLALAAACKREPPRFTDTITTGVIPIAVDESFRPVVDQELAVFEALHPYAGVVPIYGSEVDAVSLLMRDSVRFAVTTRPLSPEEKADLNRRAFFPREIRIATDGIALITHPSNPDSLLSTADLRRILSGEITRWRQLDTRSPRGAIEVVFDNPNSSTVRFAVDSVCRGAAFAPAVKALQDNASVIRYISRTPDAIGVVGVSWIGDPNDSTRLSFSDSVRVLAVSRDSVATPRNSYRPYQAYLALGRYPLTRNVYIVLNDPRSALPTGLAAFFASDRGQRIVLRSGMVPATQTVRIVNIRENL